MLMMKISPLLWFGLPALVILVAWLFGVANLWGLVLGVFVCFATAVGTGVGLVELAHWDVMWATMAGCMTLTIFWWLQPLMWLGFSFGLAKKSELKNSPAGQAGRRAKSAYQDLSPEARAKIDELGKVLFRAGCQAGADQLRQRGHKNAAGVAETLTKL